MSHKPASLLLLLSVFVLAADAALWSDSGCFAESDISSLLQSQGSYLYQTPSYCQQQCSNSKVSAVMDGRFCFCGLTVPLGSLAGSSSNCNVACQGYGTINCGGKGYLQVFVNGDVEGSTMASSSSTSSSSLTSTSISRSTSSTDSSSTESSSSSSSFSTDSPSSSSVGATSSLPSSRSSSSTSGGLTTIVSTVTSSPSDGSANSVVEVTKTVGELLSATGSSTSQSSPSPTGGSKKSSGVSGGAIAGAVVGSLAGVAIISAILFFVFRQRQKRQNTMEDDFFDVGRKGAQAGDFASVPPGTFIGAAAGAKRANTIGSHNHKNSNTDRSYSSNTEDAFYFDDDENTNYYGQGGEEFGRRRLSNGSLPDMLTRNPGSLQVVNN